MIAVHMRPVDLNDSSSVWYIGIDDIVNLMTP